MDEVGRLAARVRGSEPRLGPVRLVCVDGPAGSGKTTLAARLAAELGPELDAQVVHVDELLEGWGGLHGVWPRLQEGILDNLARGLPGRYRRYDWVVEELAEVQDVPVSDVLILEGCGSARRAVDGVAVLKIWVEVPVELRLARGMARDGEHMRPEWLAWMADEAALFAVEDTRERADVIVAGDR